MAKNERKVKRMEVESWLCRAGGGGDRGEAVVRCCKSMAVENFFFSFYKFFIVELRVCPLCFAVCLGYENEFGLQDSVE